MRLRRMFDEAGKERMSGGGKKHAKEGVEKLPPLEKSKARDKAGESLNISGKLVDAAPPHRGRPCASFTHEA